MENKKILNYERGIDMIRIILAIICLTVFLPGCAHPLRYDGPYKGRVIDSDTREPIEGVVILGTWYTEHFSPAGPTHDFYDAKETVTDKNGEFSISGKGLRILSNLDPMNVLIFKAGYEYLESPWVGLKSVGWKGIEESYDPVKKTKVLKRLYDPKKKVAWDGDKAIIPLRKLTIEERKKRLGPPSPPSEASFEKVRLMLKEIEKDDIERGLPPRKIWKGKEIK